MSTLEYPEVTIKQGTLRGSTATDIEGNKYYSFQGIPYAKPPVGELRFKAPVQPENWNGVFDATKEGSPCYARDVFKPEVIAGSENCLVLNVYTKKLPKAGENSSVPVLFWIHGGGFIYGSGSTQFYGPDLLITENVVIVTINYRLGLLGFLSLEDSSLGVPGNAGFKDMVMALKWVQTNISKFGGDPNNVTIFGESAGGASIHLLVLSQMTKGLFHKAIAQSGCALNPWVKGTPGVKNIASVLGLDNSDEKTVYNELMKKSVEEIYEIQEKVIDNIVASERRPFGLTIEKNSREPFLAEEPIDIIHSGSFNHVPFVLGYTTAEGICFELFKNPSAVAAGRPTFEDIIPWFFGYQLGSPESKAVGEKIKQFYYGSEEPSETNVSKKYMMMSDCMFVYGIYVTLLSQFSTSKAPIYLYRVSIETSLNFFKIFLQIKEPGASHCDDLGYLFKHFASPEIKPGTLEEKAYKRFVKLWTNFAKYGNPTPNDKDPLLQTQWKPVKTKDIDFLDIGENLIAQSNPEPERMNFWKDLFANSPAGQKTQCSYLHPTK